MCKCERKYGLYIEVKRSHHLENAASKSAKMLRSHLNYFSSKFRINMYRQSIILCVVLLCALIHPNSSFVIPPTPRYNVLSKDPSTSRSGRAQSPTSLKIFGPKQALAIELKKNPAKTEATIANLMKKNKLTRSAAEKRLGEYLVDPDGFALRAGAKRDKEEGYKNWEEAAVGRSKDPVATRERIDKFKRDSQFKALGVIAVFSAVLLR